MFPVVHTMKIHLLFLHLLFIFKIGTGEKISKFGCQFDDASYNLHNVKWTQSWPTDPVYGTVREGTLHLENERDFQKLEEKISYTIRTLNTDKKFLHNSIDPLVKFYKDYKQTPETSFRNFYKSYIPKFPPLDTKAPPPGNAWNGLIMVHDEMIKYDPRIADYFIMATCDRRVSGKTLKELVKKHADEPPNTFQHEHIAGVIKFSIGSYNAVGYLIIDMGLMILQPAILMENPKHKLNRNRVFSREVSPMIRYTLQGNPVSYIQMEHASNIIYPYLIGDGYSPLFDYIISRNALFIRKSLCSFASIEKAALLNPFRKLNHYSYVGSLLALISVPLISEDSKPPAVTLKLYDFKTHTYKNQTEDLSLMDAENYTNPIIDKIIDSYNMTGTEFYGQLRTLSHIQKNDEGFLYDMVNWYCNIHFPAVKSFLNMVCLRPQQSSCVEKKSKSCTKKCSDKILAMAKEKW